MIWLNFMNGGTTIAKSNVKNKEGIHLKSGLVWILNGQKEVGLQIVRILNGIRNPEAQSFEIRTNGCHFEKKPFEIWTKRPDFEWSGFLMAATIAIAIFLA